MNRSHEDGHSMSLEGVIKFQCAWEHGPAPEWHKIGALNDWRQLLFDAGLIGADLSGIGFGNASVRDGQYGEFIITGSGTGAVRTLRPDHFTRVVESDIDGNRIRCRGPVEASSESLTHAAFYRASHAIRAVIHVHHRQLWTDWINRLPTTSEQVEYGTPEMAKEVLQLLRRRDKPALQMVVMGGHEDGVMAYGASIGQAAATLLNCCDRLFRR